MAPSDDEGEEVTSCVMVPSAATQGATQAANLIAAQRVNDHGDSVRGLGDSQKTALAVTRKRVNKILRDNPGSDYITIGKTPLVADLEKALNKREAARMITTFLLPNRIIESLEGLNYRVHQAALTKFSSII